MQYDINHCRFSGTILDLRKIKTKTGTPMANLRIQCWKEQIRVTAFKDLATEIIDYFQQGNRIEIAGRLQTTSWERDGVKRYGVQIIATEIKCQETIQDEQPPLPPEPTDEFAYQDGPF